MALAPAVLEKEVTTYNATKYGIRYVLTLQDNGMGFLAITGGTLSKNVSAEEELVSLSDFSNDLSGKTFKVSVGSIFSTDPTKRFYLGTTGLVTSAAISSGTALRGSVSAYVG